MRHNGIELVCFDVGGVLIRCVTDWQDACRRAGLAPFQDEFTGEQRDRIERASRHFESGGCSPAEFAESLHAELGPAPEHIHAALDVWLLELYPGIEALLDRLHRSPLRTAVLSNTNAVHWPVIQGERFAPIQRVQHHFASHLIGTCKPDPAIYAHVERQLALDPGRILFFDDRRANIDAARRRGWNAEPIDPADDTAGQIEQHLGRYHLL